MVLGSVKAEIDLLSLLSIFQMLASCIVAESTLVCLEREVTEVREGDAEVSYSSKERSAEEVEDVDNVGEWTISCKNEGRRGAGVGA